MGVNDVNLAYNNFQSSLFEVLCNFSPLKKSGVGRKSNAEWFSKTLKNAVIKRKRLYKIWKNDFSNIQKKELFLIERHKVEKSKRKAKKD